MLLPLSMTLLFGRGRSGGRSAIIQPLLNQSGNGLVLIIRQGHQQASLTLPVIHLALTLLH